MRILFFLWCLSFYGKASAQTISPLWCHELNREKGLSSEGYNFYTYCDKQDFIWISSTKGLNRFDGLQVRQYRNNFQDTTALFGENIQSPFFENSDGQLWFCTYEAVQLYDRSNDQFQHFFVRDEAGKEIKQAYYVFYLEQDRYLWFRADDKIHRVDVSKPAKIQDNFAKSKGLYTTTHFHSSVGTDNNGKVKYIFSSSNDKEKGIDLAHITDGSFVKKVAYFNNEDDKNPPCSVFQVYYASEQSVWLATAQGMVHWDLKSNSSKTYSHDAKYTFFTPTKEGNFIVSFYNDGIYNFNPQTGIYTKYHLRLIDQPQADVDKAVRNVYLDHNNVLWITVRNKGILYTHLNKTKFSIPETPLPDYIDFKFLQLQPYFDNQILASFQYGILLLHKDGSIADKITSPNFPIPKHLYWEKNTERIWVASNRGIYKCNIATKQFEIIPGTERGNFLYIRKIQDGSLLASSFRGLFRLVEIDGQWQANKIEIEQKQGTGYTAIFQDQKANIYICKNEANIGVYRYESDRLVQQKNLPIRGAIYSFAEDTQENTIWIASSYGLVQLNIDSGLSKTYTVENGLPDNSVYHVFLDQERNLWINTYKGISLCQKADETFQSFSLADGSLSNTFKPYNSVRLNDTCFWIAGNNGITVINPETVDYINTQPAIKINKLYINDELYDSLNKKTTHVRNINQIETLQLSYQENSFSFEFLARDYADPNSTSLSYSYKMDQLDKKWINIQPGQPGSVRYSNMASGDYELLIKASNSDGKGHQGNQRKINIHISAPFWETTWFRILFVSVISLIVYGIYKYRIHQVRETERLKTQIAEGNTRLAEEKARLAESKTRIAESKMSSLIAQMNPHFIFNALQSVNRFVLKGNKREASEYLGRFSKLIRMMLENSRYNMHSLKKEIAFLNIYMEIEARRLKHSFDYQFIIDPQIEEEETNIPTMLLQPFIENSIWYGLAHRETEGGKIEIHIYEEGNILRCTIEDNGVGRAEAARIASNRLDKSESMATTIVQERIDLFFPYQKELCTIQYEDLETSEGKPCGTRVSITLPTSVDHL